MKNKECYLAFYVRSKISMSFDAMPTSPVEYMNSSLKNGMGETSNSNTRLVDVFCHDELCFLVNTHLSYNFFYYGKTLMKLAKGSKNPIMVFEKNLHTDNYRCLHLV
jgi:hypothetical protein